MFRSLQEVNAVPKIASFFFYWRVVGFWPVTCPFTKITFTMHVFLRAFRAVDISSNSEHLILEDCATGLIDGRQKRGI